jgi:hypothetical protein
MNGFDKLHIAAVFLYRFLGKIIFLGKSGRIIQPFINTAGFAAYINAILPPIRNRKPRAGNVNTDWFGPIADMTPIADIDPCTEMDPITEPAIIAEVDTITEADLITEMNIIIEVDTLTEMNIITESDIITDSDIFTDMVIITDPDPIIDLTPDTEQDQLPRWTPAAR